MGTQERYYQHKTAKAILDLYKSLPATIQQEVLKLITSAENPVKDQLQVKKEKEKQFYLWIAKNRIGLPKGYKFDREEAHAR